MIDAAKFKPPAYVVYVRIDPTPKNGIKRPIVARVRNAVDIADAKKAIEEDRLAMGETFGGLIEPVATKNRHYMIYKAEFSLIEEI